MGMYFMLAFVNDGDNHQDISRSITFGRTIEEG